MATVAGVREIKLSEMDNDTIKVIGLPHDFNRFMLGCQQALRQAEESGELGEEITITVHPISENDRWDAP